MRFKKGDLVQDLDRWCFAIVRGEPTVNASYMLRRIDGYETWGYGFDLSHATMSFGGPVALHRR